MVKAKKVLSDVILLSEIEAIDIQVWRVPSTKGYPEEIRYSYNYRLYVKESWIDVIRWDNYHSKRPHREIRDPKTGKKTSESDVFRTPEEVIEFIYGIRNEMKEKWIR